MILPLDFTKGDIYKPQIAAALVVLEVQQKGEEEEGEDEREFFARWGEEGVRNRPRQRGYQVVPTLTLFEVAFFRKYWLDVERFLRFCSRQW